ncbi:uncharacterized protein EV154DRAFT_536761 [Mucor mucedo]|uniref:Uncharacterized protein n=1 Tax=Mucor saturninus TaxID=64648 RepID=A0A8H7R598_9FUNG|nr:uncharacterized protein EV154DRAFT_536761 [Mucor mucedo]KAG2204671.1 hypothetical protein INT47_011966 [Mucor saturninus]KAI7894208.1 hypothetical protein EV154DRAFT_536761 [Mucor mucedo]
MSNTFASLLRGSRLATYDRSIAQVYTTPLKHKQIGDWGLKRNLPTVIRTRYATIEQLDTAEHQTPWQPGDSQVLFVKRWKENFPASKKPVPRLDSPTHNIVEMTPAEFNRFLHSCSLLSPSFQHLLKKKELVPEQVFDYLNVTFKESAAQKPVGPTYSDYDTEEVYPVQGRILNAERHGHAVGIAGVVGFLPKRHSMGLRQTGNRKVRQFYVESAKIDEEGKPHVLLTLTPPGAASLPFMLAFDEDEPAQVAVKTNRVFLTKKPLEDDNLTPHPDHDKLMSRIADLINKK